MQTLGSKRLVASAVVFLFTSFSTPAIAAATPSPAEKAPIQQESVMVRKAPTVRAGVPRVVSLADQGQRVIVRGVNYSRTLINDLKGCVFEGGKDNVAVLNSAYGNQKGGYVNLSSTDMLSGFIDIQKAQNSLEQNIQDLLKNPGEYDVRADIVNTQLAPKIVADSESGSTLLGMEAWDFRLVNSPKYSEKAIEHMFTTAYSTFKAYASMAERQSPDQPVVVHTSFWGTNYNNNARMTTAIQIMAAEMAGVDKLVFHIDSTSLSESQVLFDAQDFVAQQKGAAMDNVLDNMYAQSSELDWQAGSSSFSRSFAGGSDIARGL